MGIFNRKELTLSLLVKMLSLLEDPLELWCIYAPVLSYAVAFYLLESFVASANNFVTSFGLFLVVLVFPIFFNYFTAFSSSLCLTPTHNCESLPDAPAKGSFFRDIASGDLYISFWYNKYREPFSIIIEIGKYLL